MISSIELINWKTHGNTKLSFSKGTNILIGQMGAGKSSIMDAISFGLFGTFPAIKNRRVSVNGLIRNRPEQQRSAKVRISFTVGQDSYTVEREIALDEPAKASLKKNGSYVQSQPQRVTEEVEKALMMDYDLFSRAIYSEQNRLDYFLELRASERKKQIDNLLGLDKFANAQENTTSLINRIREMVEEGRKTAESFDIEGQKKQMALLKEEKGKIELERKGISDGVARLRERLKKAESELKALKERYSSKVAVAKEIAELESKIGVMDKEVRRIDSEKLGELSEIGKSLDAAESRSSSLKREGKAAISAMQEIQNRLGKVQNEISSIAREVGERETLAESVKGREKGKVARELDRHKAEMEKMEAEIASATAQRNEAERWIKELEKHISKCPVCERDMDKGMKEELLKVKKAVAKELAERGREMQEKQKAGREEAERLNLLLNRLAVVEEKLKGFGNLEERKARAESELEKAKEESSRIGKEAERLDDETNRLNEEISRLRNAKATLERRSSHLTEVKKAQELAAKKRKELEGVEVSEEELELAQKEFTSVSAEISGSEAFLEGVRKAMEEKAKQLEEKRRELERVERLYDEIKSKRLVVDNLVKFSNSLQETQAHLRKRLVNSINSIMKEIWPELYPYGDYPSIELGATEDDYVLRISTYREGRETWEDVDAIASGGERSIACLAMRVAFAMVLVPNLRWLILDEPTHNIDQQGIQKFVTVFNEKLPQIVEQIFIITHDEQLKQVSNGKVYMLSRDKARNEESSAEEL